MVQLQILSKILASQDSSILINNNLTEEYFPEYLEELKYIKEHQLDYGNVPDIATFIEKFPEFETVEVAESDRYLIDTIREEHLYAQTVPILKKAAELLKSDANAAAQFIHSHADELNPNYSIPAVDITQNESRVQEFIERSEHADKFLIPTGFPELDDCIGGWETGEEFVVIVARTNQGKSWIAVKTVQHAWQIGKNVGYISPEMSANKLAYRFDTLNKNLSNLAMLRGDTSKLTVEDYQSYMEELHTRDNKFLVSTPADFNREITVGKLRNYIVANKLDLLAVDGITYLTDERYKRGDNKTTTLTNISEDLMQLSVDLKVPIIVVIQSNRNGVKEDGNATPELEDIRDSDGVAQNATKVLSLKQKDGLLVLDVKKNRYGRVGDRVSYTWDIDKGVFEYAPAIEDTVSETRKEERKQEIEREYTPNTGRKIVF